MGRQLPACVPMSHRVWALCTEYLQIIYIQVLCGESRKLIQNESVRPVTREIATRKGRRTMTSGQPKAPKSDYDESLLTSRFVVDLGKLRWSAIGDLGQLERTMYQTIAVKDIKL